MIVQNNPESDENASGLTLNPVGASLLAKAVDQSH